MFLMPGVQSIGRWGNVMGGQDFTTDMYVEGIPITNAVVQGEGRNLSFGFSVEAIEQFQVETSGTAVMFNGQGASNYVVKSGTNTVPRRAASSSSGTRRSTRRRSLPRSSPTTTSTNTASRSAVRSSRNQMFFFVAYDGYRDRRQTASVLTSIPTLAQRSGDFSALPVAIYDPRTTRPNPNGTGFVRDPFPGNIIPPDRISPISRYFQSFLPDPTNAGLQNNYLGGSLPIGFNNENVTGKVDLKLTARQQVSVLFSQGKRSQATPYRGGANSARPRCRCRTRRRGWSRRCPTSAQVKHTYVLGSRWVNQASVGFSRLSVPISTPRSTASIRSKAGLRGLPARRGGFVVPRDRICGPERADAVARDGRARVHRVPEQLHAAEQSELDDGKHAMTFGLQAQRMDAERARAHLRQPRDLRLQQRPDCRLQRRRDAACRPPGNAYASFLLGDLNATNVIEDSEVATSGRFYTYAFWAQDDFKLTPEPDAQPRAALRHHEAVHRGLRPMVVHEPRRCRIRRSAAIAAPCGSPATARTAANAGRRSRRTMARSGRALGVAYSLNERTVLRAAYGINYSRRGAVGGRAGARNGTGTLGFSANASFPSPNGIRSRVQLEQRRAGVSAAAVLRSDPQRRLRHRPRNGRRRDLWRSGDRRPAAAVSELERRLPARAGADA